MKLLADEAHSRAIGPFENRTVESYISIKKEAKDLIKEFRELAKESLTGRERSVLRMKFSLEEKVKLREIDEQLKKDIRELNAARIANLSNAMNMENDLDDKIRDGNLSVKDAMKELREEYRNKTKEEKEGIKEKLKDSIEERRKIEERFKAKRISVVFVSSSTNTNCPFINW